MADSKFQKDSPGIWFSIHTLSLNLKLEEFSNFLHNILKNLECIKCRNHALEYLSNNSLNDYKNQKNKEGEYIGMFKWTWEFHNSANKDYINLL